MASKKAGFGLTPAQEGIKPAVVQEQSPADAVSREEEMKQLRALVMAQAAQLRAFQALEEAEHKKDMASAHPTSKERFRIVIDEGQQENDNPEVFIGYQGVGHLIMRGYEVDVPAEWLGVLDTAVETRFIMKKDSRGMPLGLVARSARRFPYKLVGKSIDADGKLLMDPPVAEKEGGDTSEVVRNS